jgi:hypothetical protein
MSALRNSKPRCWYERKRLAWSDGYEILLRVEAALWRVQAHDAGAQATLDHCRRAVLVEMGYAVEAPSAFNDTDGERCPSRSIEGSE